MSDAWAEIQALKSKRDHRRKRLEERKKERQDLMGMVRNNQTGGSSNTVLDLEKCGVALIKPECSKKDTFSSDTSGALQSSTPPLVDESFEHSVLSCLANVALSLPIDSKQLLSNLSKTTIASHDQILNILEKFVVQELISVKERACAGGTVLDIVSADHTKLTAMTSKPSTLPSKRKVEENDSASMDASDDKKVKEDDVLSLLSMSSTREKENKRIGEEILELLSRPSTKEKKLTEQFRSQGGSSVQQFCPHGTKIECKRVSSSNEPCSKLHFRKIIQTHTDESLGDCSFLNTCFHMESCKYVHYEVDQEAKHKQVLAGGNIESDQKDLEDSGLKHSKSILESMVKINDATPVKPVLHPPQWIQCDLRFFDMTVLGQFSVIMADPPWDIHMELPYGTLSDDEMRQLNIPALQDDGLIFLWVTGRAMELGRECLQLWGYERVDELIWVKTNQLQRIIRTGRTGHWLNHGKEHCLVGMKGNPPVNRGLDCDVIVAEVRATSHKPDEIYGIIERLSPGTRKLELFGRLHNIQPNWITLGNQLNGIHLVDEEFRKRFYKRYPDGNCMNKIVS